MKKLTLSVLILVCFSTVNITMAKEIFAGYTYDNKERYIQWDDLHYAGTNLIYNSDQIAKYAAKCINENHWTRAENISNKIKGDYATYGFKFHWMLESKIIYVDLADGRMTCREGK